MHENRGDEIHGSCPLEWITVSLAGLVALLGPNLELVWFIYFIAVWALLVGVLELLIARSLRRHIPDEWFLTVAGVASLILGVYFLFDRSEEGASMLRWLGIYAGFSAIAGAGVSTLWLTFFDPPDSRRLRALHVQMSVHRALWIWQHLAS